MNIGREDSLEAGSAAGAQGERGDGELHVRAAAIELGGETFQEGVPEFFGRFLRKQPEGEVQADLAAVQVEDGPGGLVGQAIEGRHGEIGAALAPLFAVPDVDQRAIVMVSFGVLMQATFSFVAASYFGRRASAVQSAEASPTPDPAIAETPK